jgi:hypothetical protein
MFRKKVINASSNLKRGLHLGTKIKSNGWLLITWFIKNYNTDLQFNQKQYVIIVTAGGISSKYLPFQLYNWKKDDLNTKLTSLVSPNPQKYLEMTSLPTLTPSPMQKSIGFEVIFLSFSIFSWFSQEKSFNVCLKHM